MIPTLEVIDDLYHMKSEASGKNTPMISDQHYKIIMDNADMLNSHIIYDRDYTYNYFGFKVKHDSVCQLIVT